MPKLYEYFGISIFFYAGEHLPGHMHGRYRTAESKAEIITANGRVVSIRVRRVSNRRPLAGAARKHFIELVRAKADEIVQKWMAVFVLNQEIKPEIITRRIQ
jgi:Domain of unknown function (DUF4160)